MSKSNIHQKPRYTATNGDARYAIAEAMPDLILEMRRIQNELVDINNNLKAISKQLANKK